jgi:hypothetical protein
MTMAADPTPLPVPEPEPGPAEEEMFDLDLDAYRAAQAETAGKPRRVRYGGQAWEFPPDFPVEMGDKLAEGLFGGAVKLLLGDEQGTRFMAVRPPMSRTEFTELTNRLYALDLGESHASPEPSKTISGRSRPTSSGTTGSTSGRRAGARKR